MNPSWLPIFLIGTTISGIVLSVVAWVMHCKARGQGLAIIDGEVSNITDIGSEPQLKCLPCSNNDSSYTTSELSSDELEAAALRLIEKGVVSGSDLWCGEVAHRLPPECLEPRYLHTPRHASSEAEEDRELAVAAA